MTAVADIVSLLGSEPPACAVTLGWTFREWDADTRTLTVGFEGRAEFGNPAGVVQGGFLAAMMDDAMGPAIVLATAGARYAPTIDLHVHYLRPVRLGAITVRARVVQLGRSVAFCEAELYDARDRLCARATCSNTIMPALAKFGTAPAPLDAANT